jgi:cyclophilin family peptidyl-prolyl cis-trans isomerase
VPTEKRQRQKAGRQARLAAEQKVHKRRQNIRRVVTVVIVAAVVVGISLLITRPWKKSASSATTTTTTAPSSSAQLTANNASKAAGCPESPTASLPAPTWKSPPPMTIDPSKTYTATIKTDLGTITANLDAKTAPTAVNDFVFLAKQNYYRCVTFHRVIPQFMDQTGDPTGTGSGSVGYTVQGEVPAPANPQYPIGSLAMAKTTAAPNGTSSNQFFIVAGSADPLPPDYALFGQVTSGQNVVDAINADGSQNGVPPNVTHRMLSVTITES